MSQCFRLPLAQITTCTNASLSSLPSNQTPYARSHPPLHAIRFSAASISDRATLGASTTAFSQSQSSRNPPLKAPTGSSPAINLSNGAVAYLNVPPNIFPTNFAQLTTSLAQPSVRAHTQRVSDLQAAAHKINWSQVPRFYIQHLCVSYCTRVTPSFSTFLQKSDNTNKTRRQPPAGSTETQSNTSTETTHSRQTKTACTA